MNIITHSKPFISKQDSYQVQRVLASGNIAAGNEIAGFEYEMSKLLKIKHASAVSSGTSALYLALLALGVNKNDEVIIPSYVCTAVVNAVLLSGAKPVLADCLPGQYNISPIDVKNRMTNKTKAVIVPHLFGQPVDMKALCSIGLPVIEDCAQTLLADYSGKKSGQWGAITICSFYATKLLTTGEGGMVLSNNKKYAGFVRDFIDYDEKTDFKPRFNFKMTDFQAALGRAQLKRLADSIRERQKIAKRYTKALSKRKLSLPAATPEKEHIFFRYVIGGIDKLDEKISAFHKQGITARKPIYIPLHLYLNKKGYSQAEKAWKTSISLPLYPNMSEQEIQRVEKAAQDIL